MELPLALTQYQLIRAAEAIEALKQCHLPGSMASHQVAWICRQIPAVRQPRSLPPAAKPAAANGKRKAAHPQVLHGQRHQGTGPIPMKGLNPKMGTVTVAGKVFFAELPRDPAARRVAADL